MDKEKVELVGEITRKVLILKSTSKNEYFLSFLGHVNLFSLEFIKGGYIVHGNNERIKLCNYYLDKEPITKLMTTNKCLDTLIEKENKKRTL